jgi:two-component system sensor histidine kinase/response regulator
MKNNTSTTRFLQLSLAGVVVLCLLVFASLFRYSDKETRKTIEEVGSIYMTGMSERITMHFDTTIDYRIAQLQSIVDTYPPDSHATAILREQLINGGRARNFVYLGLYAPDTALKLEPLFGEEVELVDPDPFYASLEKGEKKVAVANSKNGDRVLIMGVPAAYPMRGGGTSTAILAALPMDYIQKILALGDGDNNSMVYCHVIRADGSFVIRSGDAFRDSYYERLQAVYGHSDESGTNAEIAALQKAIDTRQSYSHIFTADGMERNHIYCTPLPYSEWYLVMVLPYGQLDNIVNTYNRQWMGMTIGGCVVVLLVLVLVFVRYLALNRQQIIKLQEMQERAEQASQAKSEFLSNMSHDIRTPMNAIVGMTAIAIANIQNPQQVQNCLRKISLSSKHLLSLINDVLDMAKIESGKLTLNADLLSLREVMNSIVNIVQPQVKAKNQKFDVFIRSILSENVLCDGVRLNQVLINLLSNAIKFTPEGGEIQISLSQEESPKGPEYIRSHIWVKDNGIGMAPEFQQKIFESFVREDNARVHKTEGTGLGMSITKYIVDAMDGTIDLNSAPGMGTEFHIVLDLPKAEVQEQEMLLPSWRMLVVDDDEDLCSSTTSSLREIGIDAEWTLDGETAIQMAVQRLKRREPYHIILLDWRLPGMDGIQTARQLRQQCGDEMPILLISAYDWGEIEEQAREAGICGFISKPLFKSTLFYSLRQFIGDERAGAGVQETAAPPTTREDLSGHRVLLAEDNDLNWEIAEELLSELGLHLERAENGQICAEMFRHSEEGYYDAILMDVRMPVMTGYQATEAIRAMDRSDAKTIPIIAMTADAFAEDMQKCLDCGMNAHVAKPIDVDLVARLLVKYIEEQKQHEA